MAVGRTNWATWPVRSIQARRLSDFGAGRRRRSVGIGQPRRRGPGGLQPRHRRADGQPGRADPATCRAYRRRRRQAAAPAADARRRAAVRLSGDRRRRHVDLAACVEFIHTATLLHDDVVDESQLRRGLASANAVFGNKASVLVGDFLFARAFQLMVDDGSLKVLAILSNAAATIAEGEVLQLVTPERPVHHRSPLSGGHPGQDGRAVRRRLPGRRRGRRSAGRARKPRSPTTA